MFPKKLTGFVPPVVLPLVSSPSSAHQASLPHLAVTAIALGVLADIQEPPHDVVVGVRHGEEEVIVLGSASVRFAS